MPITNLPTVFVNQDLYMCSYALLSSLSLKPLLQTPVTNISLHTSSYLTNHPPTQPILQHSLIMDLFPNIQTYQSQHVTCIRRCQPCHQKKSFFSMILSTLLILLHLLLQPFKIIAANSPTHILLYLLSQTFLISTSEACTSYLSHSLSPSDCQELLPGQRMQAQWLDSHLQPIVRQARHVISDILRR